MTYPHMTDRHVYRSTWYYWYTVRSNCYRYYSIYYDILYYCPTMHSMLSQLESWYQVQYLYLAQDPSRRHRNRVTP